MGHGHVKRNQSGAVASISFIRNFISPRARGEDAAGKQEAGLAITTVNESGGEK